MMIMKIRCKAEKHKAIKLTNNRIPQWVLFLFYQRNILR